MRYHVRYENDRRALTIRHISLLVLTQQPSERAMSIDDESGEDELVSEEEDDVSHA